MEKEKLPNSAQKLIDRIISEARDEAEAMLDAAAGEAERTLLVARDDIFKIDEEAELKAKQLREAELEKSRPNAALDSRKYALKTKRQLVDEAFALAADKLNAMEQAKRLELIKKLLLKEAEGGELIKPAKADRQLIASALDAVNAALKEAGKAALSMDNADAGIDGGFVLTANGYEKNCSFAALLRDVRAQEESAVAAILFG